jgi:Tol biopolymer transport system component
LFATGATNVVPNDTNGADDVFVRDARANTVQRVDLGADGSQTSGSDSASIDASGRYVVFVSDDALVPSDADHRSDLYRRDLQTGTVTLVSLRPDGSQFDAAFGGGGPLAPTISGDGNLIAFDAYDTDGPSDRIYLRDVAAGTTTQLTGSTSSRRCSSRATASTLPTTWAASMRAVAPRNPVCSTSRTLLGSIQSRSANSTRSPA